MFVSTFSTYVHSNSSQKITKATEDRETKDSFASKLLSKKPEVTLEVSKFPIDYVNSTKAFGNRYELNFQTKNQSKSNGESIKELALSLSKHSSLKGMASAYTSNSKLFSFVIEPKPTLNQTPTVDTRADEKTKEVVQNNLRNTMVNTYLENDNYYLITA